MVADLHYRYRTQTATLWEVDGVDSAGEPTFSSASPRQILVRWEESSTVFIGDNGEELNASSFVIVGEDLSSGDFLYLGTSVASSPFDQEGSLPILGFKKTLSPSGRFLSRIAYLSFRRKL